MPGLQALPQSVPTLYKCLGLCLRAENCTNANYNNVTQLCELGTTFSTYLCHLETSVNTNYHYLLG